MNAQFGDEGVDLSFEKGYQFPEAWSPFGSGTQNFQTFREGAMKPVSLGESPTDSGIRQ
jgi:hypothetical protein